MIKTKLSIILDTMLISISITFIAFFIINKFTKNAFLSFFSCILMNICLFFVIFKKFNNNLNLSKIKIFEQKNANYYLNFLLYTSKNFDIDYYSKLLNATYIKNNIYHNNNAYYYINLKTKLNDFDFKNINEFYLSDINKPFIIITNNYSEEFFLLIKNSPTKYILLNYLELYNLMKNKNYYPTSLNTNDNYFKFKKFRIKSKQSLNSKNFIKFFLSGIFLILFSIFIPFSKYYMISGSFLLILAIISLFNKNSTKIDKFDLLKSIEKTDTN